MNTYFTNAPPSKKPDEQFVDFLWEKSQDFIIYLKQRYPTIHLPEIVFEDFQPSDDWMSERGQTLIFNKRGLLALPKDFAMFVALHELFHFLRQGIKTKAHVNVIRDNFNWVIMQLADVEADVELAWYLKTKCGFNYEQYLSVTWEGKSVFKDVETRRPKLERFIGSNLSIFVSYISNKKLVLLPSLAGVQSDETYFIGIQEHLILKSAKKAGKYLKELQTVYEGTYNSKLQFVNDIVKAVKKIAVLLECSITEPLACF